MQLELNRICSDLSCPAILLVGFSLQSFFSRWDVEKPKPEVKPVWKWTFATPATAATARTFARRKPKSIEVVRRRENLKVRQIFFLLFLRLLWQKISFLKTLFLRDREVRKRFEAFSSSLFCLCYRSTDPYLLAWPCLPVHRHWNECRQQLQRWVTLSCCFCLSIP